MGNERWLESWQHEVLAPFAEQYRALVSLGKLSDRSLEALLVSARACTQTNCGWDEYRVAQVLIPEINNEQQMRRPTPTPSGEDVPGI